MLKKAFPDGLGTSRKVAVVNVVLVATAFIWYFYAFNFLMDVSEKAGFSNFDMMIIWGINFLGIAMSAILGASFIDKFKRRIVFLRYWMLAGVVVSLAPIAAEATTFWVFVMVSATLGIYFGLGMPICMGYYAANTEVGNRSRLSGITFLLIGLGFFLLSSIGISDITLNSLILSMLRVVGLAIVVLLKPDEKPISENTKVSYSSVVSNRSFLLYFIPWCMFLLVNYMAIPINSQSFPENLIRDSTIVESILAGIFAVIGGFFADFTGRKRLAVAGFTLLGLGYACLGLFPENMLSWWFYTAVDGIAWGVFYTIFLIIIWGDLAIEQSGEKYYTIGSLPFLLSNFMRLSVGDYVATIPNYALFSFASLFLFLAVLPLIYAPETLPEKKIRERELKKYIEKARKAKEKYA
jgi:MFS family permease